MQWTQGQIGRVFALRLEHGEKLPQVLEDFCAQQRVAGGLALAVGGADDGSRFVVGPENGAVLPPNPMIGVLSGAHEVVAVGLIFPDETGRPMLHMHAVFGRGEEARAGCIRAGIVAWQVLEILLIEITGLEAVRLPDARTGFKLLQCRHD